MIKSSHDDNFIIFNPDTLGEEYFEIKRWKNIIFLNLDNLLLLTKKFSFDKNLNGT